MRSRLKSILIVLTLFVIAHAGVQGHTGGSISGGVAIPAGESAYKIGMNFEGTVFGNINSYISAGAKIGFNRWSLKKIESYNSEIKGYLIFLELLPLMRLKGPINENSCFFFELAAGLDIGIVSRSEEYQTRSGTDSYSEGNFGLSLATGFDIDKFEIKPEFKTVFTEGENSKWFALTIGIAL